MDPRPIMLVSGHVRPIPGDLPVGGAARQAIKLSRALLRYGVDACLLTFRPRLRYPARELVGGVPVYYVNSFYGLFRRRGFRRFEAMLRVGALIAYLFRQRHSYDVIHIHTAATSTALAGVLAGRWLNKPVILKVTNSGDRYDLHRFRIASGLPWATWWSRKLRAATCVVALNEEAYQQLLVDGFHSQQIVQIPNGVEVGRIAPKRHYDSQTPLTLLYLGRIHRSKNLVLLFNALRRLPSVPAWRLLMVGDGPARSELVALGNELGLAGRIVWKGEVANVYSYLQQGDIFVLPSHTEGISNALLEAMAAGLPCVAADNAGNRRVITHCRTGLLVPPDEVQAWTDTLTRLMNDVQERERLGRAARRTVETRFDIEVIAQTYIDLYHHLVRGKTPLEVLAPS